MNPTTNSARCCALAVIVAGLACGNSAPLPRLQPHPLPAPPARPASCTVVAAGTALDSVLASSAPGTTFCLEPGIYVGRSTIPAGVTVWGPREAVLKTTGVGTTVTLVDSATLLGLTVDGSGGRFDVLDAAVRIGGRGGRVEGVAVRNSTFGILVEKARSVTVRGNDVVGTGGPALGMRGDGIRLWETQDSVVEDNHVTASRDCVVWYSSDNVLRRNVVRDGRYGLHFMYSHRNRLEDSVFTHNEVGVFAMYSRDLLIRGNSMSSSEGAASMGIGVKESGNLDVRDNLLVHNSQGIFLDSSPMTDGEANVFQGNVLRLSEVAVTFLSSRHANTFRGNDFRDNTAQVRVEGGGDAMTVKWEGNHWDDYAGYDMDADGTGDVPYELTDLADALESRRAELAFLRGTPALALVSVAGHVAPLFAPRPVLRDAAPRMNFTEARRAN